MKNITAYAYKDEKFRIEELRKYCLQEAVAIITSEQYGGPSYKPEDVINLSKKLEEYVTSEE